MTTGKLGKFWSLITILLVFIIIAGGIVIWSRYQASRPIEISLLPPEEFQGEIYVSGAVNNPGSYPIKSSDRLEDIITGAGGTADSADLTKLKLYILQSGEEEEPQRIDINRAEAWLLEALPGIGEVRAKAIIDYREQNGPFRGTSELIKVEGIGISTYERIKHLVTVAD